MFLETTTAIGHKKWSQTGTDPLGNPVEGWADPVDLWVYGYGPAASLAGSEPTARPTAVITAWQVFAPPGTVVNAQDRYIMPGQDGEWEQDGELGDYTHGPFGWAPGVVIQIRRVVG